MLDFCIAQAGVCFIACAVLFVIASIAFGVVFAKLRQLRCDCRQRYAALIEARDKSNRLYDGSLTSVVKRVEPLEADLAKRDRRVKELDKLLDALDHHPGYIEPKKKTKRRSK